MEQKLGSWGSSSFKLSYLGFIAFSLCVYRWMLLLSQTKSSKVEFLRNNMNFIYAQEENNLRDWLCRILEILILIWDFSKSNMWSLFGIDGVYIWLVIVFGSNTCLWLVTITTLCFRSYVFLVKISRFIILYLIDKLCWIQFFSNVHSFCDYLPPNNHTEALYTCLQRIHEDFELK